MFCLRDDHMVSSLIPPRLHVSKWCSVCWMTTWFPLESHPDYLWVSDVLLAGWPHGFSSNPTQTTCEKAMFCLRDDHMVSSQIPPRLYVSKRCSVCGMTTWFPLESHPDYLWVSDVLLAGWPHGFPSNPTQTTCELVMSCLQDDHMVSRRIPPKLHVSKQCSVCGMTTWFPLESHPNYMRVSNVLFVGWPHGFPSNPTQTTCE